MKLAVALANLSATIESFGNYFFIRKNPNSELKFLVSWRARTWFIPLFRMLNTSLFE